MKKLLLLIYLVFGWVKAQQNKNYLFMNNGIMVYTAKEDGSFRGESFIFKENKNELEGTSSVTPFKPSDDADLKNFYASAIPVSKTSILKDFENLKGKSYTITNKTDKSESRVCFYGSRLFVEGYNKYGNTPNNFDDTKLVLVPQYYDSSLYGMKYQIYENFRNTGVNLFTINQEVYVFKTIDDLLIRMFPDYVIKESERRFSHQLFPYALKITDGGYEKNGEFIMNYGVSDEAGKVILSPKYEKIIICMDAILAKEKGLWYFYDFFGNKIRKEGYRKILPLESLGPSIDDRLLRDLATKDGLLTYAVLEKNEVKKISKIYAGSKIDFINRWYIPETCGTRSSSWTSSDIQVSTKNNAIDIEQTTISHGSRLAAVRGLENDVTTKRSFSFQVNKELGSVKYLNKKDSISNTFRSFGLQERLVFFFKMQKDRKESMLPINFRCGGKPCNVTTADDGNFFGNPEHDVFKIEYFDKIEDVESKLVSLNMGGDYFDYLMLNNVENNLYPNMYYKLYNEGKVGLYFPRVNNLGFVKIKYKNIEDLKNRFFRFVDENGKKGLLSEDGEEFFD